jgi:CarD family transcriptional regulator
LFSLGDKIVYGSDGVFTVSEYASSPIDKNDTRQFYVLRPVHGPAGNIIMTPVDNERAKMRPVMSREEAMTFIDSLHTIEVLTVEREKNRRDIYRAALETASRDSLVSIIKTVQVRRIELAKIKKRPSESDNDYEKKAKHCLYGELAIALEIPLADVERFIECRLESVAV